MGENFKLIKLDGVDFKAEGEVIKAYTIVKTANDGLQTEIEKLKADNSKVQAEKDTLDAKLDTVNAKIKELEAKKLDEKIIDEAVSKKLHLIKISEKAGIEIKDSMDSLDIKKAIITKITPKAVLEGKDEIYIDARFDGAVEMLEETDQDIQGAAKTKADNDAKIKDPKTKTNADADATPSYVESRAKYIKDLENNYKKGAE